MIDDDHLYELNGIQISISAPVSEPTVSGACKNSKEKLMKNL